MYKGNESAGIAGTAGHRTIRCLHKVIVRRGVVMLPTIEQLKRMQNMNIMELDRDKLANAEDIEIDSGKSMEDRVRSFIEQTGNPFAQNVGGYILQIGFMEGTDDLIDDRMILLAKRNTQIMV